MKLLRSDPFAHLDVFHGAFERIDRLRHELQPVPGGAVERPHPGRLGVRRGRRSLLLLRLISQVILILQHLHFQHLTHHVSACAAQQREREVEDKTMVGGGGGGTRHYILEQKTKMASPEGVGVVTIQNKEIKQDKHKQVQATLRLIPQLTGSKTTACNRKRENLGGCRGTVLLKGGGEFLGQREGVGYHRSKAAGCV